MDVFTYKTTIGLHTLLENREGGGSGGGGYYQTEGTSFVTIKRF
jgi:hypothetical protein